MENKSKLRKEIKALLWKHSLRKFRKGYIGEKYLEYPEYLTDVLVTWFESKEKK